MCCLYATIYRQGVAVSTSINIELIVGTPSQPYKSLGLVEGKVQAATNFSKTPTIEDANFKLQEAAARLGANAIINVTYERGISLTSWRALTAKGEAVILESDDYACPICAETIKRAAVKCRFCGADLNK
jgi:hypothetical protein